MKLSDFQYNPIELIWAQVIGEVATKNTTFRLADVEKLMYEAIDSVRYHGKLGKMCKIRRKTTKYRFFLKKVSEIVFWSSSF